MTCWKCGRAVEEGAVECDDCSTTRRTFTECDREVEQHKIDWDRVQCWQDVKAILEGLNITIFGGEGTTVHDNLRRYLKRDG